jgi:hypothetical protein
MFVFQGGGHGRRDKLIRDAQKQIEAWRVVDTSVAGARLVRNAGGARHKPGNLVALRGTARGADNTAQLAEVRWCMETTADSTAPRRDAALEAGIEVLAQAPVGIAVRLTGVNIMGARNWTAAFRASGTAGGHLLITPTGWYKPGRTIELRELRDGKPQVMRWLLGPLKRRGVDFEMMEASPTA